LNVNSHNEKNTDIEVLRAIAILFTLVGHFTQLFPWPVMWVKFLAHHVALWSGVDLFFVISGFVISRSLLRTSLLRTSLLLRSFFRISLRDPLPQAQQHPLKAFWIKRVFRLWPSAWLWLVVAVMAAALLPASAGFISVRDVLVHATAAFFNIANFFAAHYAKADGLKYLIENPLVHYWSLSVEEQFYIVLPVALWVLPPRALVPLLIAGIAIQFNINRPLFTLGWYTRTDALLWGVLLGICFDTVFYQRLRPAFMRLGVARNVVFVTLIVLLAWLPHQLADIDLAAGHVPASYALGVIALVSAILVFIASFDADYLMHASRFKQILVGIGARSYSLYLIHYIVFMIVAAVYRASPWRQPQENPADIVILLMAGVLGSFALTELNYRYVEVPLRERGRLAARRYAS